MSTEGVAGKVWPSRLDGGSDWLAIVRLVHRAFIATGPDLLLSATHDSSDKDTGKEEEDAGDENTKDYSNQGT